MTITEPAMILPHKIASVLQNPITATVAVMVLELVSIKANKNSFQEKIKQNTAETTIPGAARGKAIRKKEDK